jgi:23S rRNA (pseudouridine1915-N3)-methyltransferase
MEKNMMNINLIAVGKLKERYLSEACNEYIKRLTAFCNLKVYELEEYRLPDRPSEKDIEKCLENEAKAIMKVCRGYTIAMCIEGKQFSSMKFAERLENIGVSGNSTVNIIIGSSFGIADSIKKSADMKLSMSEMTFPHQLARVMVLEQVYRAFQILSGGKYHK